MMWGGGSQEYCTPGPLLEPVYALADGPVAMDPCSNPSSIVKAKTHTMLPENIRMAEEEGPWLTEFLRRNGGIVKTGDGLKHPWSTSGIVFVNPPFGSIPVWMERAAEEAENGVETVMLTNADTSTAWFQDLVYKRADGVAFFKGRKRFIGAKSSNPLPHLFTYWGYDPESFREVFRNYGRIMK